ncbi:hypothetical protein Tco_0771594 [Tanacetum coccineum]|uniref:Uncharacterized protein n=1 Tax=Tanacetum coccineum TaxID=301880 RepID=A0ABQ4ZJJ3_9ASTR
MDSMHSTLSMYYDYGAHVKGELLVMMKNSQSVNLLIFISNTLIELFTDFGFDCDGIPKRPTMYLNLWSYKVVRHRYSNPMIQPEPEGSTQGYPLDSVEVLRLDSSAGNPVKEILLKLNLPNHRSILTDSRVTPTNHRRMTKPYSSPRFIANCFNARYLKMGVKRRSVKVKEIQEDALLKLFKIIKSRKLGPKVEDVEKPVNPFVFLARFLIGALAGVYYVGFNYLAVNELYPVNGSLMQCQLEEKKEKNWREKWK